MDTTSTIILIDREAVGGTLGLSTHGHNYSIEVPFGRPFFGKGESRELLKSSSITPRRQENNYLLSKMLRILGLRHNAISSRFNMRLYENNRMYKTNNMRLNVKY